MQTVFNNFSSNGSDEESEVDIAGEVNGENAEGAVWNGNMNGSQDHNMLPSQMAAANGADAAAEEEEGASGSNENIHVRTLYSSFHNNLCVFS